jgi:hypothetical protein
MTTQPESAGGQLPAGQPRLPLGHIPTTPGALTVLAGPSVNPCVLLRRHPHLLPSEY